MQEMCSEKLFFVVVVCVYKFGLLPQLKHTKLKKYLAMIITLWPN